jgi:hypothetical protein
MNIEVRCQVPGMHNFAAFSVNPDRDLAGQRPALRQPGSLTVARAGRSLQCRGLRLNLGRVLQQPFRCLVSHQSVSMEPGTIGFGAQISGGGVSH